MVYVHADALESEISVYTYYTLTQSAAVGEIIARITDFFFLLHAGSAFGFGFVGAFGLEFLRE